VTPCNLIHSLPVTLHSHISEDSTTAVRTSRFTDSCFTGVVNCSASKLIVLRDHSSPSCSSSSLALQPFNFGVGCLTTDCRSVLSKTLLHLFTPIFQQSSTSYTVIYIYLLRVLILLVCLPVRYLLSLHCQFSQHSQAIPSDVLQLQLQYTEI
jgi:hypothetical protein